MRDLFSIAADAKRAKAAVGKLGSNDKNRGLCAIADALIALQDKILTANAQDISNGRENGLNEADCRPSILV